MIKWGRVQTAIVLLGGCLFIPNLWGEAVPVEIIGEAGNYVLLRAGEPYFIKGVGGNSRLDLLASIGGNSLRTWGSPDYDLSFLDKAHSAGLSVCVGLWVDHERHGFDYNDDQAVQAQIGRHCAIIDRYKDHPAVLLWGIGNEVELQSKNPRVWEVIEAVAAYAKKVDPHHPTMTVVAQSVDVMEIVRERCPSIDILGCNSYGGIGGLAKQVRESGWQKPYIVTEWGSDGSWEVKKTSWGAGLEPTSTEKAVLWKKRHGLISSDSGRCLGGYAFYWGNKQETTPTWFGVFIEDGSRTELLESLQLAWTGKGPVTLSPRTSPIRINRKFAQKNISLKGGSGAEASFKLTRGDLKEMRIRWELMSESSKTGVGGDWEKRPDSLVLKVLEQEDTCLRFTVPESKGAYRLFLYVYGKDNTVATANFPFLVR
jgi:hypothetical protein